jgi:hypothetical protein
MGFALLCCAVPVGDGVVIQTVTEVGGLYNLDPVDPQLESAPGFNPGAYQVMKKLTHP